MYIFRLLNRQIFDHYNLAMFFSHRCKRFPFDLSKYQSEINTPYDEGKSVLQKYYMVFADGMFDNYHLEFRRNFDKKRNEHHYAF